MSTGSTEPRSVIGPRFAHGPTDAPASKLPAVHVTASLWTGGSFMYGLGEYCQEQRFLRLWLSPVLPVYRRSQAVQVVS